MGTEGRAQGHTACYQGVRHRHAPRFSMNVEGQRTTLGASLGAQW